MEAPPPEVRIRVAGVSATGPVRDTNEDAAGWQVGSVIQRSLAEGEVVVAALRGPAAAVAVADGLGGHGGGDLASRTALSLFLRGAGTPAGGGRHAELAREAVQAAHSAILAGELEGATGRRVGPQTTITAAVLDAHGLHVVHVGDSRLYRLRDETLELLTVDHSQAMELVRMRVIRPEQAASHPGRHLLTRSLGGDLALRADVRTRPIEPGDAYLLCTDGLWSAVETSAIRGALEAPPADGVRVLLERAFELGGDDNATAVIVKVDACPRSEGDAPRAPWSRLFGRGS